jgi:hypothetical protein
MDHPLASPIADIRRQNYWIGEILKTRVRRRLGDLPLKRQAGSERELRATDRYP